MGFRLVGLHVISDVLIARLETLAMAISPSFTRFRNRGVRYESLMCRETWLAAFARLSTGILLKSITRRL
jgi:hypothetical protein